MDGTPRLFFFLPIGQGFSGHQESVFCPSVLVFRIKRPSIVTGFTLFADLALRFMAGYSFKIQEGGCLVFCIRLLYCRHRKYISNSGHILCINTFKEMLYT